MMNVMNGAEHYLYSPLNPPWLGSDDDIGLNLVRLLHWKPIRHGTMNLEANGTVSSQGNRNQSKYSPELVIRPYATLFDVIRHDLTPAQQSYPARRLPPRMSVQEEVNTLTVVRSCVTRPRELLRVCGRCRKVGNWEGEGCGGEGKSVRRVLRKTNSASGR
ncbi:hypothetical protein K439DRAFT_1638892, partial [Ramaria rubella]